MKQMGIDRLALVQHDLDRLDLGPTTSMKSLEVAADILRNAADKIDTVRWNEKGVTVPDWIFNEANADIGHWGACKNCGFIQGGCEPDAVDYPCERCEKRAVYGLAELAVCGCLTIVDDDDFHGEVA